MSRGVQRSTICGYIAVSGATPMTVYARSSREIDCPMIDGDAAKRDRQSRSEMTTTFGDPGPPSPSAKKRPRTGLRPSTEKNDGPTVRRSRRFGSPPFVAKFAAPGANCDIAVKLVVRSRKSRKSDGDSGNGLF